MRKPLVIGNWKMNGSLRFIEQLPKDLAEICQWSREVEIVICPPFVYLGETARRVAPLGVKLGSQHVSEYQEGAYTGEVGAAMLNDVGCSHVLIGHSERRALFGADDARIAGQLTAALAVGLTPVLCVGEDAAQRAAGQTWAVLERQLAAAGLADSSLTGGETSRPDRGRMIIAYEPVWAIGGGQAAGPADAQEVLGRIRQALGVVGEQITLLYGGSVTSGNVAELMAQPDLDGVLVGGASLRAREFTAICEQAAMR